MDVYIINSDDEKNIENINKESDGVLMVPAWLYYNSTMLKYVKHYDLVSSTMFYAYFYALSPLRSSDIMTIENIESYGGII